MPYVVHDLQILLRDIWSKVNGHLTSFDKHIHGIFEIWLKFILRDKYEITDGANSEHFDFSGIGIILESLSQ
jgi:hypothetical protein